VFELTGQCVWVAGHRGMVGSAIHRALDARGDVDTIGWTSTELDLTDRTATLDAAAQARPDVVVLVAARVGGIVANDTSPVEFLTDNLRIQANVMEAAHAVGVQRLLFLGSSCIYPRDAAQPMTPDMLLTGPSTAEHGSPASPPTSTAPGTATTSRLLTCCPRSSAASTRQPSEAHRR
jgi:nucleoside-diphosphate-sugar epimerase